MLFKIKRFFLKKIKQKPSVKVSASVKDYDNEEFFVQKAEATKAIIAKFGYPKELGVGK
jgi:hypothetical protein